MYKQALPSSSFSTKQRSTLGNQGLAPSEHHIFLIYIPWTQCTSQSRCSSDCSSHTGKHTTVWVTYNICAQASVYMN